MTSSLSEDEIQGCHRAFVAFDTDGSGSIEGQELKEVLRSMGQDPSEVEILQLMTAVDEDNSGSISFTEFLVTSVLGYGTVACW